VNFEIGDADAVRLRVIHPERMSTLSKSKPVRRLAAMLFAVVFLAGAGCQTLAPSREQQLQAVSPMNVEVNPELAEPVTVAGTLLYLALPFYCLARCLGN